MQGLILAIVLLTAVNVSAQYWGEPWENFSQWIDIEDARPGEYGNMDYDVMGGVQYGELAALGLPNIAYHTQEGNGYYLFSGEYLLLGLPPNQYYEYEMMFPPGILRESDMTMPNEFKNLASYCYDCACGELAEYDTMYMAHGFGFWYDDPNHYCIWGIDHGYCVRESHQFPYHRRVCPPAQPFEKSHIVFTDSLYSYILPDTAVISGLSPLYLRAYSVDHSYNDTLYAKLYLEHHSGDYVMVPLYSIDLHSFAAKGPSAVELGLESFNLVKAELYANESNPVITAVMADRQLNSAIPEIKIHTDIDTVYIRSDSMKISEDFCVCLHIYDDAVGDQITAAQLVDSVGYKYKSRWTANSNRPVGQRKTYYRQYPTGTRYLQWQHDYDDCTVIFSADSLYVIGGDLTIEAKGKLDSLPNINQHFTISTDTLAGDDTMRTKWIRIDIDPTNARFLDSLKTDRMRGVAWKEGAGTLVYPPHPIPYPLLNHYWSDTKTPCENGGGVDTGIMQIYRTGIGWSWEKHFSKLNSFPSGYIITPWDNMTWNWTINIFNGIYIHNTYYRVKIELDLVQSLFPESCSYADCGIFPGKKNKEDLKSYGYHSGEQDMHKITNDSLWTEIICDTFPPIREDADYVQKVRRFRYEEPW